MSHRVSVIVPVWNMARFLPDAIASIPDVHEIIIVAADSDDNTFGLANELARQRLDIRVLAGSNKAPASARNIGLREASGDVIAFIDADDIWPRGKLALQLERLDREPQADVVAGLVTYFTELDRERLAPTECSSIEPKFIQVVGAAIFRRSVFDHVGLFDESLMYAEDGDLLLRIVESRVPFVILNTSTLYYRRHVHSMMSRDDPRKKSDFARIIAMSLARRRRLGLSLAPVSFDRYFESTSR
jgi:glycosyltransferase involved in cell wall biosynthesis